MEALKLAHRTNGHIKPDSTGHDLANSDEEILDCHKKEHREMSVYVLD